MIYQNSTNVSFLQNFSIVKTISLCNLHTLQHSIDRWHSILPQRTNLRCFFFVEIIFREQMR